MDTSRWTTLVEKRLETWWEYAVLMLPNFVLALIVVVVFFFAAKTIRNVTSRFFLRLTKSASVSGLVSGALYSFVIVSGIMSALDILELDKTVSSLLAGVGIIGLALGFAFQDLTANFISGAYIAFKRPFDVGHTVETNGFLGTIEEIELRSTTLRTAAGLHVIIPNKDIFQKPIINYSRTDSRRIEFEFVIPNTVDALLVEKIIHKALQDVTTKNIIRNMEFYFTAIEHPNLRINISFWTNQIEPREFMKTRHSAILAIYETFTENGVYTIQIPKPNLPAA